ncbi:MAG TPA: GNAT family N-acetyltransferase, partial [Candidatus Didemnitutus sp.]|nr:GNAT family N-acetyltransferase [Candidatus Didemnitutus sp.]
MAAPILAATLPPRTIHLRDGGCYRLRVLRPADAALVLEMFATLSPETIRARYGYLIRHMKPDRAHQLVLTDSVGDISLGLCETLPNGQEKLWAIGRLVHTPDNCAAECAFLVHDAKRRLGIAARLLLFLRVLARRRGLARLFAQVQQENRPMLAVFRKNGAILHFSQFGDVVEVEIP